MQELILTSIALCVGAEKQHWVKNFEQKPFSIISDKGFA
jgi:hypothetical protein